jgi:hypothetical protein
MTKKADVEFDLVAHEYEENRLLKLKEWIDGEIAKGHTKYDWQIDTGYYDSIDEIRIKAYA